ncbi:putative adenylate cyclase protein [Fulvimarina pelagi HTCC2506]|uniref:Putative adenylate cyclase protein n=1 Tax=Fulvimarina pelagi HTCC2506 TaxID=314231 RepID=Q0FXL8_9HYPH|nr:adenylate/guanylate cyclase domain-containing protein [Fulvimarina pelagi]EAU39718.1 putative adenylate cyclase protein [Fulvimarina pelagi HTCC2506]
MRARLISPAFLLVLVFALAWPGWLGWRHVHGLGGPLDRIETTTLDWRVLLAGPLPPPETVAVVAIDDETIEAEGGYPLDRRLMARLVENLRAAGAKAIAIDILFADAGEPAEDAALLEALSGGDVVIAGAGLFDHGSAASLVPRPDRVLWPQGTFAQAVPVGLVNVSSDSGGTPRHVPLVHLTRSGPTPSFVLQAVSLYEGEVPPLGRERLQIGDTERRLDLGWHVPLRFYGPRGGIPTVSAERFLAGRPDAPDPQLAGRLVLVGVTATAMGDTFATPFDARLPGVEVLATGAANLIEGTGLTRDSSVRRIDAVAALALATIGVVLLAFLPLGSALAAGTLLLIGWMLVTVFAVGQGFWLASALPIAGAAPPIAAAGIWRWRRDTKIARAVAKAEAALRRMQPRALAARIAEDPGFLSAPRETMAAILFIDLAGFTTMSERLGTKGTRDVLKRFHSLIVEEVMPRDGIVLSFMGDGAMIVFGLPDEHPDDGQRALAAAFALMKAVKLWLTEASGEHKLSGVRLGGHYGPVILSRLGHDEEQHIAATGDSVNTASRLMEVAKENGAALALSKALWDNAGSSSEINPPRTWRTVSIRGRDKALDVGLWD